MSPDVESLTLGFRKVVGPLAAWLVLFAIAGKFDWDHVVEQVQALFGDWSGQAPASPEQRPVPTTNISLEHQEG